MRSNGRQVLGSRYVRRSHVWALALFTVLPAACTSESLPETLPAVETEQVPLTQQQRANATEVFFDVSRGVEGFLPDSEGKPAFASEEYVRLVQDIPDLADRLTHHVSLNVFGATTRQVSWQERRDLRKRDFYRCLPSHPCTTGSSELSAALQTATDASASKLIVIVTPLTLTQPSLTDLATEVMRPLAAALRAHLSVGILGLRLPFSGSVYDLVPNGPYRHDGERGVYVIAIGSYASVRELTDNIAQKYPEDRRKLVIFTGTPVCTMLQSSALLDSWTLSEGIQSTRGLARLHAEGNGETPPQLHLERGADGIEAEFDMSTAEVLCPHVPLLALAPTPEEKLWVFMNQRWQPLDVPLLPAASDDEGKGSTTERENVEQEGMRVRITILSEWTRALLPERTFFYVATLRMRGYAKDARAVRWLKDWTLQMPPEKAPFLRTPLLERLGDLLMTASTQTHESAAVAQLSLVFTTE